MHPGLGNFSRAALVALLLFAAAGLVPAPGAAAPAAAPAAAAPSGTPLQQGQQLYDAANFGDAVTLLRDALSAGRITGSDAVAARALLGRALVKLGKRLEARQAFQTALRTDPAFRLDSVVVPPDEMDVFNLALAAVTAEQIEAGRRVPASLLFFYGKGPGDNTSLGEMQKYFGGKGKLDPQAEFGGSVRFPLRPRFSLDIEFSRVRATGKSGQLASASEITDTRYEAAAIPLILSLYWTAVPGAKFRANLFAGGGRLLAATNSIDMRYLSGGLDFRFLQGDTKTGSYVHVGGEAEYMVHPKLSLAGRVLYRNATATNLIPHGTALLSAIDPGIPIFKDRKVDFSGVAFNIGLRAYIGY